MRKLHTSEGLDDFLRRWNCVALARPNCISISTSEKDVDECVREIANHLGLLAGSAAT
jgi:hypothetical protein